MYRAGKLGFVPSDTYRAIAYEKRGTQEGLGDSDRDQEGVAVIGWTTQGNNVGEKGKTSEQRAKGIRTLNSGDAEGRRSDRGNQDIHKGSERKNGTCATYEIKRDHATDQMGKELPGEDPDESTWHISRDRCRDNGETVEASLDFRVEG
jgi:hypothetical protein